MMGAGDALTARVAEDAGFDAIWASGLCISALSGLPDSGLLTMTELVAAAEAINRMTSLPVIADCDTGFGAPDAVARTARMLEEPAALLGCASRTRSFRSTTAFGRGTNSPIRMSWPCGCTLRCRASCS